MRWVSLIGLAVAAVLAASPVHADSGASWQITARPHAPDEAGAKTTSGRHGLADVSWADVYVPKDYDPTQPAPLAVLLHGSGDRGRTMIDAFQDQADKHGALLLAIDSQSYSWDIMVKGAHLKNTTRVPDWGNDVDRIDDAIARMFELYAVDPKRIALVGFSDGAGYGLSLGANNAELFSSVMVFAPGLLTRVDGQARGRVFIAHGEQDRVLPVAPSRDIFAPALRQLGFGVSLRLFQGRHEMPEAVRAEAFNWWLRPEGSVDAHATAR